MYERFSELALVERGRRCLLRRREQMEEMWDEMVEANGKMTLADISTLFKHLDKKWYLDGALLERIPQDFTKVDMERAASESGSTQVTFEEFFKWFEEFVKTNDILRASAFSDAERRLQENEQKARKAEEEAARRSRAMQEAMERRSALEEEFEKITADMYINTDISRIMNKGAIIEGVEEKEGGPPLQGEHIELIRQMLEIWGCPVTGDTVGDIWNDCALAAWQQWLKARSLEASRGVDKQTLRQLIDKDEFLEYLQVAYPVADVEAQDYVKQVVEVRRFVEDEVDTLVEAVDEDTGEELTITVPENEVETIRQRLAEATTSMPLLAMVDRVSGRIMELVPAVEE